MPFCKNILSTSAFLSTLTFWLLPVGCRVYRLEILSGNFNAVLYNIHLTEAAVLHGPKLAEHIHNLVPAFRVIIRQLDFALQTEIKVSVIFCFRIVVVRHLGVLVYRRFVVHCVYCFWTGFQ